MFKIPLLRWAADQSCRAAADVDVASGGRYDSTYHHVLLCQRMVPMTITARAHALEMKAKLFRGFADSSRLAILEALREGPQSVTELTAATGLSQSNASNHLGCLHDCGLVQREQRGRFVYYGLSEARVEALLGDADELLLEVARGVYECVRYARREREDAADGDAFIRGELKG